MNTEGILIGSEKVLSKKDTTLWHSALLSMQRDWAGSLETTQFQSCRLKFFTSNPVGISTGQTNINTENSVNSENPVSVP